MQMRRLIRGDELQKEEEEEGGNGQEGGREGGRVEDQRGDDGGERVQEDLCTLSRRSRLKHRLIWKGERERGSERKREREKCFNHTPFSRLAHYPCQPQQSPACLTVNYHMLTRCTGIPGHNQLVCPNHVCRSACQLLKLTLTHLFLVVGFFSEANMNCAAAQLSFLKGPLSCKNVFFS